MIFDKSILPLHAPLVSHREIVQNHLTVKKPLTIGAIADQGALGENLGDCDIIELRLDSLGLGKEVHNFALNSPLPLLVTARGAAEGGQSAWSIEERAAAYRSLLPQTSLIDIELRDFEPLEDIIREARDAGVIVIGSFHDFDKTPPLRELLGRIDSLADIHKFALMAQSIEDITEHLNLMTELSHLPLSVMGMGPLGAAARPLMAKAGSLLNYGFLGASPTAPDQWPASLLKKTLEI